MDQVLYATIQANLDLPIPEIFRIYGPLVNALYQDRSESRHSFEFLSQLYSWASDDEKEKIADISARTGNLHRLKWIIETQKKPRSKSG